MEKIAQGAEAILYRDNKSIIKTRIKKGYRLSIIDEMLRKRRTKKESSLISDARRVGVPTPNIISVKDFDIVMEFIDGEKIKDILKEDVEGLSKKIGKNIALLHEFDIIHGDLTTSNMILKDGYVFFIDFGLGFNSKKIEDKAVDLHLLYQVLESTHYKICEKAWSIILKTYRENYDKSDEVLRTLKHIEKRGRYKVRE